MRQPARRVLLVHPELPSTSYWGMQHSVTALGKRAFMPSLGLLTIAAMFPATDELRHVDMNCEPLREEDIAWADIVCFSAMIPQRDSLFAAAARCRRPGKLVIFGGPYPSSSPDECRPHCDVMVLDEAEAVLPALLADLALGTPQERYPMLGDKPDVTGSPTPRFDLLRVTDYTMIPIQLSRGCPFQCEFCNAPIVFGRKPRVKTPEQVLRELDALFATGYRGLIFIVDDNLIGNKKELRRLLPALQAWNRAHGDPFLYTAEASVNLADDEALLAAMAASRFSGVFLGIETPSVESLRETRKLQNTKRSMVDSVHAIQRAGILVSAGFIVGFDSDGPDIFDRQIEFIRQAGIPNAMLGLLFALPGTPLHERMEREGRLDERRFEGGLSHAGGATNLRTVLPRRELLQGYRRILATIYEPRAYFARVLAGLLRTPKKPDWAGRVARMARGALATRRPLELLRTLTTFVSHLPSAYRRAALRFGAKVVRQRPDLATQIFPLVAAGVHAYRLTFDFVLRALDDELLRTEHEPAAPDIVTAPALPPVAPPGALVQLVRRPRDRAVTAVEG